MSCSNRNTLISELTQLQIIHLDIHTAKSHFKKIGSSFTWYIIKNTPAYQDIRISGIWKKELYTSTIPSQQRNYIPLLYTREVFDILSKTVDNKDIPKFAVQTSSDLHHYTKKTLINKVQDSKHPFRLIHTPKQTVWCSRPHKYQHGWKVFISLTDKYQVWIDNCGMTQSVAFIQCHNKQQAELWCSWLQHSLYQFLNNICRYGNFNNIKILQHFPIPSSHDINKCFNISSKLQSFILQH